VTVSIPKVRTPKVLPISGTGTPTHRPVRSAARTTVPKKRATSMTGITQQPIRASAPTASKGSHRHSRRSRPLTAIDEVHARTPAQAPVGEATGAPVSPSTPTSVLPLLTNQRMLSAPFPSLVYQHRRTLTLGVCSVSRHSSSRARPKPHTPGMRKPRCWLAIFGARVLSE